MGKQQFDSFDIEMLAAHLCKVEEDQEDFENQIEGELIEKYGISLEQFTNLINDLSPLLDMAISPLTEVAYIGFGTGKFWLAKTPHPGFINAVLQWMSADDVLKGKSKGYERIITNSGKPEFQLTLKKAENKSDAEIPPFLGDTAIKINGQFMLQLNSKAEWVRKLPEALPKIGMSDKYLFVDKNGDLLTIGADFIAAEKKSSYPVRVYLAQRTSTSPTKEKEASNV